MKAKSLWEILVPKYSNHRNEYTIEYHRQWDEKVREISNGLTILRTAKGQWIDEKGKLFDERMIPVRIYCTGKDIMEIVKFTKKYYNQKKVMAYEISQNVIMF